MPSKYSQKINATHSTMIFTSDCPLCIHLDRANEEPETDLLHQSPHVPTKALFHHWWVRAGENGRDFQEDNGKILKMGKITFSHVCTQQWRRKYLRYGSIP